MVPIAIYQLEAVRIVDRWLDDSPQGYKYDKEEKHWDYSQALFSKQAHDFILLVPKIGY